MLMGGPRDVFPLVVLKAVGVMVFPVVPVGVHLTVPAGNGALLIRPLQVDPFGSVVLEETVPLLRVRPPCLVAPVHFESVPDSVTVIGVVDALFFNGGLSLIAPAAAQVTLPVKVTAE